MAKASQPQASQQHQLAGSNKPSKEMSVKRKWLMNVGEEYGWLA
jgi:hypothetical protein